MINITNTIWRMGVFTIQLTGFISCCDCWIIQLSSICPVITVGRQVLYICDFESSIFWVEGTELFSTPLLLAGFEHLAGKRDLTKRDEVREAAKKKNRFFLGDLSQIWVGGAADSQTFGDIYQPLFFSIKVPKCGWVGQSKPKTKSKFWVKFIKCIL